MRAVRTLKATAMTPTAKIKPSHVAALCFAAMAATGVMAAPSSKGTAPKRAALAPSAVLRSDKAMDISMASAMPTPAKAMKKPAMMPGKPMAVRADTSPTSAPTAKQVKPAMANCSVRKRATSLAVAAAPMNTAMPVPPKTKPKSRGDRP